MWWALAILITACLGSAARSEAQPTNAAVYQSLASSCLDSVAAPLTKFTVRAPERMSFVRTSLVQEWLADGKVIFIDDPTTLDTSDESVPVSDTTLAIDIEAAGVEYARGDKKRLKRTVVLSIRYLVRSPSGRVISDAGCDLRYDDEVDRDGAALLALPGHPETEAEIPESNWIRRFGEPLIITAAATVAVFLFFSLRSDQSSQ
jgi:hypothetical protein